MKTLYLLRPGFMFTAVTTCVPTLLFADPWPLGNDFPVEMMQVVYAVDTTYAGITYRGMNTLKADGFNIMNPYGGFYSTESAQWQGYMTPGDYLDAAETAGVSVNFAIGAGNPSREMYYSPTMVTAQNVQTYSTHNALYGWYVFPEEVMWNHTDTTEYNNMPKLIDQVNTIRANDAGNHPITSAQTMANGYMDASDLGHFKPYYDHLQLEVYPNYFAQPRSWVRWEVEQMRLADEQSVALDTFTRSNGNSLNSTPGVQWAWNEKEPPGLPGQIGVAGNKASFNGRDHGDQLTANLETLSLKDFDLSLTLSPMTTSAGNNYIAGVQYRQPDADANFYDFDGFSVLVTKDSWGGPLTAGTLAFYDHGTLAGTYSTGGLSIGNDYDLRVLVDGNVHKVFWNGIERISYTDTNPANNVAGYVGLGTEYGSYTFDNLKIDTLTENVPTVTLQMFNVGAPMDNLDAYHDFYLSLIAGAKKVNIFNEAAEYDVTQGPTGPYAGYSKAAKELNGTERLGEVFLFGSHVKGHRQYDANTAYSSSNSPGNDSPLVLTRSSGPAQSDSFTPMPGTSIQYDSISTRVMAYGGHIYIAAVNSATGGASTWTGTIGRFRLNGGSGTVPVLFESRNETITGGLITDSFAGREVHIYRLPQNVDLILYEHAFDSSSGWSAIVGTPTLTTASGIGTLHRNSLSEEWMSVNASPGGLGGSLPSGGFIEIILRASTATEFNLALINPNLSNTAGTGWQLGTGAWQTLQIPFALEEWRASGSLLLGIRGGSSFEIDSLGIYFNAPGGVGAVPEPSVICLLVGVAGGLLARRRCA